MTQKEIQELFNQNEPGIKKMAYYMARKWSEEPEEVYSDFCFLFAKNCKNYDIQKGKLISFLTQSYINEKRNQYIRSKTKKKEAIFGFMNDTDSIPDNVEMEKRLDFYTMMKKNPVCSQIMNILQVYHLPEKHFKKWLVDVLKNKGFKYQEIWDGFKIIRGLM